MAKTVRKFFLEQYSRAVGSFAHSLGYDPENFRKKRDPHPGTAQRAGFEMFCEGARTIMDVLEGKGELVSSGIGIREVTNNFSPLLMKKYFKSIGKFAEELGYDPNTYREDEKFAKTKGVTLQTKAYGMFCEGARAALDEKGGKIDPKTKKKLEKIISSGNSPPFCSILRV